MVAVAVRGVVVAGAGQWELASDVPVGHGLVGHLVVAELGVLHPVGQFGSVVLLN